MIINEAIKEVFFEFEDLLQEKSVLVGIAPPMMLGVTLTPEVYSDDGVEAVKCTITIECEEQPDFTEDLLEQISDYVSDWCVSNGLFRKLDSLGVTEDNLNWWPVRFEEV